nr:hypothetical protein K-LCC10_0323 [Kaumoebavirus]
MNALINYICDTVTSQLPNDVEYNEEKTIDGTNNAVTDFWLYYRRERYGGVIHIENIEGRISVSMADNEGTVICSEHKSDDTTFQRDLTFFIRVAQGKLRPVPMAAPTNYR